MRRRDVETGEIHDIEGKGQTDIDNKQIRVIGIRHLEKTH